MSDFDPWGWVRDRFLDQNQVGQDADNSGGILGPVQSGEAVAAPGDDGTGSSTSSGVDLVGLGSSQSQNGIDDFFSPTSDQPYAWSDDHGATVHIWRPDNSLETRTGGTLTWRDNNPGNLRTVRSEIGVNNSVNGPFAIFENPETGAAAQSRDALGPKYQNLTIGDAIKEYAPAKENDTEAYISDVEKRTGLDRGTVLNTFNDAQRADYLNALRAHEGFKPGTSSMAYYNPFGRWGL
jgi:hypothetical protein